MTKTFSRIASLALAALLSASLAGCSAASADTEGGRLAEIKERGVLQVATEPYFAPNEFIDPTKEGDGRYVGSDIELAQAIADEIGVELEIVPLEFSAVLASVTSGKYDLAISALAWTPERGERMEMSIGYHFDEESLYTVLVREEDSANYTSLEDLKGKKVVCQSGSLQEQLIKDAMDVSELDELLYVSATTDGYLMVSEGKADACVCASANGELYAEANGGLTILPDAINFPVADEYAGTRVGAPKGETELIEVVNSVIEELNESGQYNEWYDEYAEYAGTLGLD